MNFNKGADGEPTLLSLRRRAHAVPRVRPRPARADVGRDLSDDLGHRRAAGLRRAALAALEHWLDRPEILERFARHYKTGEPMPQALIERLIAARTFNQGSRRRVSRLGLCRPRFPSRRRRRMPHAVEAATRERMQMPRGGRAAPPAAALPAHLLGRRLRRRLLQLPVVRGARRRRLQGVRGGRRRVRSARSRKRLRDHVYAAGGARDPSEAYRAFRGRMPTVDPLLEKRGLAGA